MSSMFQRFAQQTKPASLKNHFGPVFLCKEFQRKTYVSDNGKLVLGCGSNVVDHFFKVKAIPRVGEKGYFQSPTQLLEKSIAGGVTLNHLSWASLLGVPTGLLALQGADAPGRLIRDTMKQHGISNEFVQVSHEYTTAQSYVFIQQDGERSIIMASGGTSLIDKVFSEDVFGNTITSKASMLTTEISQVPLSGVKQLLRIAKNANILSVLDLDVSPSVAVGEGTLGTLDELKSAVRAADIVKPARHAGVEMLTVLRDDMARKADGLSGKDLACFLFECCDCRMVAMTNGKKSSVIVTKNKVVEIETEVVEKVTDATGAGDAFLGGLIAGLHFNGVPETEDEIRVLGQLANKTGAACCQVLGGLPDESSRHILTNEIALLSANDRRPTKEKEEKFQSVPGFENSLVSDHEATQEVINAIDYDSVSRFIDIVESCKGTVLVSGIGKSAIVARRMAASLTSTGTPSVFIHATEWSHGELGMVRPGDIVIFFSHSGNTEECIYAAELVKRHQVPLLGIVGTSDSTLAHMCTSVIDYVLGKELVEPVGGAPTTSIVLQEMMVNGLMCELIRRKGFTKADFFWNHPGGSLGRNLSKKLKENV